VVARELSAWETIDKSSTTDVIKYMENKFLAELIFQKQKIQMTPASKTIVSKLSTPTFGVFSVGKHQMQKSVMGPFSSNC